MILLNFISVGSQLTHSVKRANELVLPVEEEMVIQGVTDTLIKAGRGHGVEMTGEKTKVKRISWQPSPVQNMINQKHLENVEYLSNLGSLIMNGVKWFVRPTWCSNFDLLINQWLNMFWAPLCPSSGVQGCTLLHMVFCTWCWQGSWDVGWQVVCTV